MIRLLVLDVDGTMTDGGVYYDATGNELKKFAIKDGAGLVLARTAGIDALGSSTPTSRFRSFQTRWRFLLQEVYFFHRDLFVEPK